MLKKDNGCDCNCIHQDIVDKARNYLDELMIFHNLEIFYKAFSDKTRLKIMYLLDKIGQMCVCDISVSLNMTKSAISHQLKYLKKNYLVKSFRRGKEVLYSIADDHVKDILEKGIEHIGE